MSFIFSRVNDLTGKKNRLLIPMKQSEFKKAWNDWNNGMLIQDAFPNLSADEREFIMTGMMPGEWDELFGGME